MAGILSKGIQLSYKETESASSYTTLTNLQEIPELGGTAESVEVTTLDDAAHMYINGLLNYGDSLNFTFLYEPTQFATLNALGGANADSIYWKVGLPDGTDGAIDTVCTFTGKCSVVLASVGTNSPLTYTLAIKPDSAMAFA